MLKEQQLKTPDNNNKMKTKTARTIRISETTQDKLSQLLAWVECQMPRTNENDEMIAALVAVIGGASGKRQLLSTKARIIEVV